MVVQPEKNIPHPSGILIFSSLLAPHVLKLNFLIIRKNKFRTSPERRKLTKLTVLESNFEPFRFLIEEASSSLPDRSALLVFNLPNL